MPLFDAEQLAREDAEFQRTLDRIRSMPSGGGVESQGVWGGYVKPAIHRVGSIIGTPYRGLSTAATALFDPENLRLPAGEGGFASDAAAALGLSDEGGLQGVETPFGLAAEGVRRVAGGLGPQDVDPEWEAAFRAAAPRATAAEALGTAAGEFGTQMVLDPVQHGLGALGARAAGATSFNVLPEFARNGAPALYRALESRLPSAVAGLAPETAGVAAKGLATAFVPGMLLSGAERLAEAPGAVAEHGLVSPEFVESGVQGAFDTAMGLVGLGHALRRAPRVATVKGEEAAGPVPDVVDVPVAPDTPQPHPLDRQNFDFDSWVNEAYNKKPTPWEQEQAYEKLFDELDVRERPVIERTFTGEPEPTIPEAVSPAETAPPVDTVPPPTAPTNAAVPFLIPKRDMQALADLGYTREMRDSLKPEEAQQILREQRKAVSAVPSAAEEAPLTDSSAAVSGEKFSISPRTPEDINAEMETLLRGKRTKAVEKRLLELRGEREQAQRTASAGTTTPDLLSALDEVAPLAKGGTGQADTVSIPRLWEHVKDTYAGDRAAFDRDVLELRKQGKVEAQKGDTGLSEADYAGSIPDPAGGTGRFYALTKRGAKPSLEGQRTAASAESFNTIVDKLKQAHGEFIREVKPAADGGVQFRYQDRTITLTPEREIRIQYAPEHGKVGLIKGSHISVNGESFIRLTEGQSDFTTLLHEYGHGILEVLSPGRKRVLFEKNGFNLKKMTPEEIARAEEVVVQKWAEDADRHLETLRATGSTKAAPGWFKRMWEFIQRVVAAFKEPSYQRLTEELASGRVLGRGRAEKAAERVGEWWRDETPTPPASPGAAKNAFAGDSAVQSKDQALSRKLAEQFESEGLDSEKIRLATGWFKGKYDGKWRFEIPDKQARLTEAWDKLEEAPVFNLSGKDSSLPLDQLLDFPELYKRYPEARTIKVVKKKGLFDFFGGLQGWADPKTNTIGLTPYGENPFSTLLHEVQHWIQAKEGFAQGGSPESVMKALTPEKVETLAMRMLNEVEERLIKAQTKQKELDAIRQVIDKHGDILDAVEGLKQHYTYGEFRAALTDVSQQIGVPREVLSEVLTYRKHMDTFERLRSDVAKKVYKLDEQVTTLEKADAAGVLEVARETGEDYKLYRMIAGEIEARDIQGRQGLSRQERSKIAPYSTENIPVEDSILTYGDDVAGSIRPEGQEKFSKEPIRLFRGTAPEAGDKRIAEPFAEGRGKLWTARTVDSAKMYGREIQGFEGKPEATLLKEESPEFWKLLGKRKPPNESIRSASGNFIDNVNEIIRRAKAAGYSALSFKDDSGMGTVILDPDMFVPMDRAVLKEATTGEKFQLSGEPSFPEAEAARLRAEEAKKAASTAYKAARTSPAAEPVVKAEREVGKRSRELKKALNIEEKAAVRENVPRETDQPELETVGYSGGEAANPVDQPLLDPTQVGRRVRELKSDVEAFNKDRADADRYQVDLERESPESWATMEPDVKEILRKTPIDKLLATALADKRRGKLPDARHMTAIRVGVDALREASQRATQRVAEMKAAGQNPDNAAGQMLIATAERMQAIAMKAALDGQEGLLNIGTGAGRLLASMRRVLRGHVNVNDAILNTIIREMGGSYNAKALEHLKSVLANPRGDASHVENALREVFQPTMLDKIVEYWKNGLVSAPASQIANPGGNVIESVTRLAETQFAPAADAIYSKMTGKERTRFAGEGKIAAKGIRKSYADAAARLGTELKDILTLAPEDFTDAFTGDNYKGGLLRREVGAIGPGPAWVQKALGKKFHLGRAVRMPLRLMGAADNFFYSLAVGAETGKLSYREARKQLGAKADEAAVQRLAEEIYDKVRNTGEYSEITKRAFDEANSWVFRSTELNDPSHVARLLVHARSKHPTLNFIVPFISTPLQIAKLIWQRSPGGLLSASKAWKKYATAEKAGLPEAEIGKLRDNALDLSARASLGLALTSVFYGLASSGVLTGKGPSDVKKRQALLDTGWQPYSVVIGSGESKTYIPYSRFEPIAGLLGIVADFGAGEKKTPVEAASAALSNITSRTFLEGLNQFFELLSRPEEALPGYVSQLAGSFVPNVVAKSAQAVDPIVRETKPASGSTAERVGRTIAARVPGVSTKLPARYGATGKGVERPNAGSVAGAVSRFASPVQITSTKPGTAVEAEMARIGYTPTVPDRKVKVAGRDLEITETEHRRLTEEYRHAAERAARILKSPAYKAAPDDAGPGKTSKRNMLKAVFDQANRRWRARHAPALMQRARAAQARA